MNRNITKRWSNKGFTVIELLLGIALIGILLPAIIVMLNSLGSTNDRAKDMAIANIAAENKMEELRSSGFNSLNVGNVNFSNTLPQTLGSPKSANYTVTNNTPGLKEILITITYTTGTKEKTLTYKSIIGELGVAQ